MRPSLILVLCLLACCVLHSQQNFEGSVVYTIKENGKKVGSMNVEFGVRAIRASFEEEGGRDKKEVFILFDSLLVAEVNHQMKTSRITYYPDPAATFSGPVRISGHPTRLVPFGRKSSLTSYFPGAVFFVGEDLPYTVPASLSGIDELLMLSDQKIVLGFVLPDRNKIPVTDFDSAFANPEFRGVIAKATGITPRKQDASLFELPRDYVRSVPALEQYEQDGSDRSDMMDSTESVINEELVRVDTALAIAVDTMASAETVKPQKVKPAAKKTPAKAPVKKKTPAAARKPE